MKNILNYVENNLSTFNKKKLTEVDALIFSWLSYYRIDEKYYHSYKNKLYIKDFYNKKFLEHMTYDLFDREKSKILLSHLAGNERFRDVLMLEYVDNIDKKKEKQFAAMTFKIKNNEYVISFRGTDHTFIGWKEDLNMSFLDSTPAQIAAKKYVEKVFKKYKGKFYIVGHSKGGNLSLYATEYISDKYKNKIIEVYNFDGPNLNNLINKNIKNKIRIKKYVPQSSVVGMCFDKSYDYMIVKSNAVSVLQHNPFSWEVDNGNLKLLKNSTLDSKAFKNAINYLVDEFSKDELKLFVNSLYEIIENTKVDTVEDFLKSINKNISIIYNSFDNLDKNKKDIIFKITKTFFIEIFKNPNKK